MTEFDYDAFTPRVAVVGVGGQGSNLVNRLYSNGIKSADTIAINTDMAHLNMIKAGKESTYRQGNNERPWSRRVS